MLSFIVWQIVSHSLSVQCVYGEELFYVCILPWSFFLEHLKVLSNFLASCFMEEWVFVLQKGLIQLQSVLIKDNLKLEITAFIWQSKSWNHSIRLTIYLKVEIVHIVLVYISSKSHTKPAKKKAASSQAFWPVWYVVRNAGSIIVYP